MSNEVDVAILECGNASLGQMGKVISSNMAWSRSKTRLEGCRTSNGRMSTSSSGGDTDAQWLSGLCRRPRPLRRPWVGPASPIASCYAACATRRATAIEIARTRILAGMCRSGRWSLVQTRRPRDFLPPTKGERTLDPDWLRFQTARRDEPDLFWSLRPAPHGPIRRDRTRFRARQGQEQQAMAFRESQRSIQEDLHRRRSSSASPLVAEPLRLFEICATSDGGAALR